MNDYINSSFDRRDFIKATTAAAGAAAIHFAYPYTVLGKQSVAPAALALEHFPSRLHALVWRNWGLVPLDRMAETVGATPDQLNELARSMGLLRPQPVTAEQLQRSYLTIIRRNWHLLPMDQLTTLLGWTADKLEFTLKEDDFFYIKLGSLKPACEPLRYADSATIDTASLQKFQKNLESAFPDGLPAQQMSYFQFVQQLSAPDTRRKAVTSQEFQPKIAYPYFALFGDALLDPTIDPYPESYLDRLAACGVDSVWMHVVLSQLSPFPWDASVSVNWEQRLENLRAMTDRAAKHGIGIYLYLNEPRHQPAAFYDKHPQLRGQGTSLCTSVPQVQEYLQSSIALIVQRAPQLAGFFSITASENPTNCWSHFAGDQCPRCSKLGPARVIAELNNLYAAGIAQGHAANKANQTNDSSKQPQLIVWDWGWKDGWAEEIIPLLKADGVALMSVSEWDLPIERSGIKSTVGEYSISSVGPGPRAQRHWALATKHGLRAIAKIQANNSWEISAVPYVPAVHNVANHIANLRKQNVQGLMLGWTLGGHPSPNLDVVSLMGSHPDITSEQAIATVAQDNAGPAASALVAAWQRFSELFSQFPYHIDVVYTAPLQCGPANLLWSNRTNYKATMVGLPYDDLDAWRAIYTPEAFIKSFRDIGDGIAQTSVDLQTASRDLDLTTRQRQSLADQQSIMETISIHYRSIANQSEFIQLRDGPSPASHSDRLGQILQDEIALVLRMATLQCNDSRLGYEASNHYFYVPQDLYEKVLNCRHLLTHWLPTI